MITDGSFSLDVVVPTGGTVDPRFDDPIGTGQRALDVPDPKGMRERLDSKSMANFLAVVDQALEGLAGLDQFVYPGAARIAGLTAGRAAAGDTDPGRAFGAE